MSEADWRRIQAGKARALLSIHREREPEDGSAAVCSWCLTVWPCPEAVWAGEELAVQGQPVADGRAAS
ncbi:MAG: hypothetical protein WKH64_16465 [Chloroflexia bacterium]